MAKQTINQGTAPTGAGGDTFRSGSAKLQANDDEIYNYLGDGTNLNKLGTAAFKNTGTQAGNVMEVGAFGLGDGALYNKIKQELPLFSGIFALSSSVTGLSGNSIALLMGWAAGGGGMYVPAIANDVSTANWYVLEFYNGSQQSYLVRTAKNTSVDSNGFIKAASPIVKLFADKIELNHEAEQQDITFEKLAIGDYLVKGSLGFAQEGWYVETPKDANGNVLVAVVYEQLENGDISVKTYDYMLNNKGRIVADTETPLDIPENRWIDLRLQELPKPEIEMPESIAPPEFQPTGLAQAVATVMESYHDPEQ